MTKKDCIASIERCEKAARIGLVPYMDAECEILSLLQTISKYEMLEKHDLFKVRRKAFRTLLWLASYFDC